MKRVVTGVDTDGRSVIVSSDEFVKLDSWFVEYDPKAEVKTWIEDDGTGAVPSDVMVPNVPGGLRFHYVVFPPSLGTATGAGQPGIDIDGFHSTRSVDFMVVISGRLTLKVEAESVVLEAGDCLIQQAARHAWLNETDAPAETVFVMFRPEYTA